MIFLSKFLRRRLVSATEMRESLDIMSVLLGFLMLNQSYTIKILIVGDFDRTQRSLQTTNSILSYLSQNKVDRFVFLGDIAYRNRIDLRDSYSVCGQHLNRLLNIQN